MWPTLRRREEGDDRREDGESAAAPSDSSSSLSALPPLASVVVGLGVGGGGAWNRRRTIGPGAVRQLATTCPRRTSSDLRSVRHLVVPCIVRPSDLAAMQQPPRPDDVREWRSKFVSEGGHHVDISYPCHSIRQTACLACRQRCACAAPRTLLQTRLTSGVKVNEGSDVNGVRNRIRPSGGSPPRPNGGVARTGCWMRRGER